MELPGLGFVDISGTYTGWYVAAMFDRDGCQVEYLNADGLWHDTMSKYFKSKEEAENKLLIWYHKVNLKGNKLDVDS